MSKLTLPENCWEPRHILPLLAEAIGGTNLDWQAASVAVFSPSFHRFIADTPADVWRRVQSKARVERSILRSKRRA